MAPRWKVKPSGFTTVKVDGWWQKPGEPDPGLPAGARLTRDRRVPPGGPDAPPAPRAGGRRPTGTTSTTRAANRRNSLVPREWVGSEGLIGNWARAPRLDPTRFETIKSSETGRWWARPLTELTGLTPGQVADVRGYDDQTKAQTSRIDQSFADFVAQSGQNAAAGQASLTGLTGLMGSGYSGDPTGAVLSEAARKQTGAGVAPIIADLARMPGVARESGITASTSYAAQRGEGRRGLLQGIREQEAELMTANADRAAELRGQELDSIGRAAGLQNDLSIAEIRANSDAADREARLAMNDADNATSRSNAALKVTEAEKKAAKKAGRKPPTSADIRQWAKRARAMWDGVNTGRKNDEGQPLFANYEPGEIIRELIAMGATRKRAVSIVRNITGVTNPGANASFPSVRDSLRF